MVIRPVVGTVLTLALGGLSLAGQQRPNAIEQPTKTNATTQKPTTSALKDKSTECNCATVPWKPDPPCVKACSALLISGVSANELGAKFKLTDGTVATIGEMKKGGVTAAEIDKFLVMSAGKEFVNSAGKANANDVKVLVMTAEKQGKKPGN